MVEKPAVFFYSFLFPLLVKAFVGLYSEHSNPNRSNVEHVLINHQ
jgi:hypothetical protein